MGVDSSEHRVAEIRFEVRENEHGVQFFVADATGHGAMAHAFWAAHGRDFDEMWDEFAREARNSDEIVSFARQLNQYLHDNSDSSSASCSTYLCFVVGSFSHDGRLSFANFGYGNHVLVSLDDGSSLGGKPRKDWGLKLGWVSSETWDSIPGAVILHQFSGVERVVLLTDGFLENDHVDPEETLRLVGHLSERTADVPLEEVVPLVTSLPHEGDDATVVAIELATPN